MIRFYEMIEAAKIQRPVCEINEYFDTMFRSKPAVNGQKHQVDGEHCLIHCIKKGRLPERLQKRKQKA